MDEEFGDCYRNKEAAWTTMTIVQPQMDNQNIIYLNGCNAKFMLILSSYPNI